MDSIDIALAAGVFPTAMDLVRPDAERADLAPLLRQTTLSHALAKRLLVVLTLDAGASHSTIGDALACSDRFIAIWKRPYVEGGVLALAAAPRAVRGHGLSVATG